MKTILETIVYSVISYSLVLSSVVYANTSTSINTSPQFTHYPAKAYKGTNAKVLLNDDTYAFRTRFRNLAKNPVNFAGHRAITFAGCGTSCVFGLMFNAKSGKTSFLPSLSGCYANDEFYDSEIYYKKNSRLLIMAGSIDEQECSSNYYIIEPDGNLKLIKQMPFPVS